mmetsp:Transcript_4673/g.19930  ORF Transcript_4673/g.19930 Transcript_4673/m.19930 type:complete len:214 (-) Transcript_4673:438-1079(-)
MAPRPSFPGVGLCQEGSIDARRCPIWSCSCWSGLSAPSDAAAAANRATLSDALAALSEAASRAARNRRRSADWRVMASARTLHHRAATDAESAPIAPVAACAPPAAWPTSPSAAAEPAPPDPSTPAWALSFSSAALPATRTPSHMAFQAKRALTRVLRRRCSIASAMSDTASVSRNRPHHSESVASTRARKTSAGTLTPGPPVSFSLPGRPAE